MEYLLNIFRKDNLLTHSLYPLLLFASILIGLLFVNSDVNELLIVGSISFMMTVIIGILEYVHPEHKEWMPSWKILKVDLIHLLITTMLPPIIFKALLSTFFFGLAHYINTKIGFELWPHNWPLLFQLILALCVSDILFYILHRSLHEIPSIWPFHAVHHSPKQLYVIASNRAHPMQIFFSFGAQFALLWTLGINEQALLLYYLFSGINGQLQHCNIKMRCGFLNWILATPDVHRWHHSIDIPESDANYGNAVMLWDILLGTRKVPKNVTIPADHIGLPVGTNFPDTYLGQLMVPFNWENIRFDRKVNASLKDENTK